MRRPRVKRERGEFSDYYTGRVTEEVRDLLLEIAENTAQDVATERRIVNELASIRAAIDSLANAIRQGGST